MAKLRATAALCATAGLAALVYSLPVWGQQGPESLLPPGFNDPAPPPARAPSSAPVAGGQRPAAPSPATATDPAQGGAVTAATDATAEDKGDEEEAEDSEPRYDVPPTARRSLKAVGLFTDAAGGFPANAYG
ncbi:MAG: hypothetical protein ACK44T_12555, partial [Sphingomonadales bacterium]